jgi:hypothetical protein
MGRQANARVRELTLRSASDRNCYGYRTGSICIVEEMLPRLPELARTAPFINPIETCPVPMLRHRMSEQPMVEGWPTFEEKSGCGEDCRSIRRVNLDPFG